MKTFSHQSRRYELHKADAAQFTADHIRDRARPMSEALRRFHNLRFETRSPGVVTISK
jgi:hypothetical protein